MLNQMGGYLSKKPFLRAHWWSSRWIAYMTIHPPLTETDPLWKRSKNELRLLRLFNVRPEELGRKIERYWKKPRWRRWLASFGMKKKIDVWNYYQRCLAYQAVCLSRGEQERRVMGESNTLFNELGFVLSQFNAQFENDLEKRCRNPQWVEKHFLKAMNVYKQRLKETFLRKLTELLTPIQKEADRAALKQVAEEEYQHVEAFMLNYYLHWLSERLYRAAFHLVSEKGIDVTEEVVLSPEARVRNDPQPLCSSSLSTRPRKLYYAGITSLHNVKEWIQHQRQRLTALMEENAIEEVERLLQSSLHEIKTVAQFYLDDCERLFATIQGKFEVYDVFLEYLNNLQNRLKPLLQGGMRLFHPDHVLNVAHSQAMRELITRYSQFYLEESRAYVERFKKYHERMKGFYEYSQQAFQDEFSQSWSYLSAWVDELEVAVKELEQSYKEFAVKLKEFDAKCTQDRAEFKQKTAEFEQKNAVMKADIATIMRSLRSLGLPQQHTDTEVEASASSNHAHFFGSR
ncbi:hypothetical protein RICGR_1337 [Rickettsiella grylli]|uniref:Uncharacterized protein n=1 Tax=Rickettsiella grylli TaxID=59196 RepID=A8PPL9_9COXI|nr:hypothetical protein RICGR_1337 [Rickettsiella grylli]